MDDSERRGMQDHGASPANICLNLPLLNLFYLMSNPARGLHDISLRSICRWVVLSYISIVSVPDSDSCGEYKNII